MMNSEPSSSSDALHRHYSRTSRAQGHVAIDATLVVRDAQDHSLAVDIADLQSAYFDSPQNRTNIAS